MRYAYQAYNVCCNLLISLNLVGRIRRLRRTYAALQSLQAGLNQSDDPAEIAKYLKANSVDTVMGPLTWDEKGDLKGFEFGVFDWHANGTATDAK